MFPTNHLSRCGCRKSFVATEVALGIKILQSVLVQAAKVIDKALRRSAIPQIGVLGRRSQSGHNQPVIALARLHQLAGLKQGKLLIDLYSGLKGLHYIGVSAA